MCQPTRFLSAAVIAILLSATTANAQSVLYFADEAANPSGNVTPQALTAQGIVPTIATSEADFVTQLGAGGWNLVILYPQLDPLPDATTALVGWVNGGGKAISGSTFLDDTYAVAFDARYLGDPNIDRDEIAGVPGDPLFAGVASPITLSNPGWNVFSAELEALSGGIVSATFTATGTAAVITGNDGFTVFNGFLDDTYDGATQAARLSVAQNQIQTVLAAGVVAVPEPGTGLLALAGVGVGAGLLRRRRGDMKHTD